jgi:hypothetical protein
VVDSGNGTVADGVAGSVSQVQYVEKRYPIISMLATQQAITPGSGGGGGSGTGGNPWKKKQEYKKATVNAALVAVLAATPPVGFRRLEERALVMGFGETTAIFADVCEIAVISRAGRQHLLEAVAVPRIHTRPAARCPQDLRYRFLRIYNPPAEEMHQTGKDTDICIGADYGELLPTYVEQQL